jgi:prevent-host-death family protein
MKTVTPTQLRTDIYNLLDEVLKTGLPLEIKKGDKVLRVVPVDEVDKLKNLIALPEVISGDPDELAEINWSDEVHLDLP